MKTFKNRLIAAIACIVLFLTLLVILAECPIWYKLIAAPINLVAFRLLDKNLFE